MQYKDIQDALATLARLSEEQERLYIEGEGEVTPETEALEEEMEAVKHLLENEGIDSLGRWLKAKEDEVKMWKAEKAAAERRMKSAENTIAFIKEKITEVMYLTGQEKVKGNYYGFTKTLSEKSSVNTDEVDRLYLDMVSSVAHQAGLPDYIDVVLKTTATALKESGATNLLYTATTATVRFNKPRNTKE